MTRTPAGDARRHYERLRARRPASITYTRGNVSLSLVAIVSRTAFASNAPNNVRLQWGERDYLILADEMGGLEPAEGDRITETLNGQPVTFDLMAPNGEPGSRWADPYRVAFRVHCKEVPT